MLHEFLESNREELISRCRAKVAMRTTPRVTEKELEYGIPVLLTQISEILRAESLGANVEPDPSLGPESTESTDGIGSTASHHGNELFLSGFTVDQVVHDYGDLCQAVTELAVECNAEISNLEFRTLNRCLDNAIAGAVTTFARERDRRISEQSAAAMNGSMVFFARELNLINTAILAVDAIKCGRVGIAGSTGALLDRTLKSLQDLTTGALVDVRLSAGIRENGERVLVSEFIEEIKVSTAIDAKARGLELIVAKVDPQLVMEVDRQTLAVAVTNLLHDAFKFTQPSGRVSLKTFSSADRVLIEIEDECRGLPPGDAEDLFQLLERRSGEQAGLGLGLSRRGVEANGGTLQVRTLPGSGCVFTIALPRPDAGSGPR